MKPHLPSKFPDPFIRNDAASAVADAPPDRDDADVRWELVDRVRREIAAGVYETPEKWEQALDRLHARLEQ